MGFNPKEHLIPLKGKDYLQVQWRLVWFREEKPLWNIDTELVKLWDDGAIFRCKIYDEGGVQKASGYGSETKRDFGDYLEKAETKAIGRALAMLGYGTQFTGDELDEGERIVDAPVARKGKSAAAVGTPPAPVALPFAMPDGEYYCKDCGKVIDGYKQMNPYEVAKLGIESYGVQVCIGCGRKRKQA